MAARRHPGPDLDRPWRGRIVRTRLVCAIGAIGTVVGLLAPGPSPVRAADHPVDVTLLKIKDPRAARGRRLTLRVALPPDTRLPAGLDPRQSGARIEIAGSLPGDGMAGPIILPPSFWRARGTPPGARGFTYVDRRARTGVRKVVLELGRKSALPLGRKGASLTVRARGRHWPFRLLQAQGPVDVRFAIGTELYCGRVVQFARNGPGRLRARNATAPGTCGTATAIRCGDGHAEGTEECDDANTVDGDGCTSMCLLENPSARCAGVTAHAGTAIRSVRVAAGLDEPVHITAPPLDPNRVFVVEQPGRVRIIENGVLTPGAFLSIESRVSCCGERGLLSIAFHPDFETNGHLFANYTATNGDTVIARYHVTDNPSRVDPATEQRLLTIDQPQGNHNGGQIAFGPDGYLYIGMGDGGGSGDPDGHAQNDASLLGKILRVDVDVDTPPYHAVPPTNPRPAADGTLGLIWARGLRNPWRFSFDRDAGDLYIGDVGQNDWEEISVQPAGSTGGENYGWDIFEGNNHCFDPPPSTTMCPAPAGFTMPVHEYANFDNPLVNGAGCSVTGGFVYRGCAVPDLAGTYFYADFCSAFVRSFVLASGVAGHHTDHSAALATTGGASIEKISSFGEDARGELYIADRDDGEIFKIVPGARPRSSTSVASDRPGTVGPARRTRSRRDP